jgi:hypothetical protein
MMELSDRAAELLDELDWTSTDLGDLALDFVRALGKQEEFERHVERVVEEVSRGFRASTELSWDGPGAIEVEYDLEYRGGNYTEIGEMVSVPLATIRECGGSVEEAFRKVTGHDPQHIIQFFGGTVPCGDRPMEPALPERAQHRR